VIQFLLKVGISALVIAVASELARRQAWFGALIASLPLTSILAMIWLWRDGTQPAQIAAFGTGIFWLVIPSLLLFLVMPLMLRSGFGFWTSLGAGCAATVLGYAVTLLALRAWSAP
jgi:F0F1-type ATP synthase assembly protein I